MQKVILTREDFMDYRPDYRRDPVPLVRFGYHATPELMAQTTKMMMELAEPYDANLGDFLRSKGVPVHGDVRGKSFKLKDGIAWLSVEPHPETGGTLYRWETCEEQKARTNRENNTRLSWRERFCGIFNHG